MIDVETQTPGRTPLRISVGKHTLAADQPPPDGEDTGPGAHDLFDASLGACKALTATWYARRNGIPLEGVEVHVERDAAHEREGKYALRLSLGFRGPLDEAQRKRLHAAVARCPVHKLMTEAAITIETTRLDA
jgi:putative redox protein